MFERGLTISDEGWSHGVSIKTKKRRQFLYSKCVFGSALDIIDYDRIDSNRIDYAIIDFERIDLCLDTIT